MGSEAVTPVFDQSVLDLAAIGAALPATFYADLPVVERVKFMIEAWQKVITVSRDEFKENSELRDQNNKLQSDLDYFRNHEKQGKRPFSDAFSGQTIEGQVKTIQRLEKRCLDLVQQVADLREDLACAATQPDNMQAMLGSTVEAQRDRIAELEKPANQFLEIERLLARRPALDGFDSVGKKVAAMLHMCTSADPSGELMQKLALPDAIPVPGSTAETDAELKRFPLFTPYGAEHAKPGEPGEYVRGEFCKSMEIQRDKWIEDARRYSANADYWREEKDKAQASADYLAKGITEVLEALPGAVRVREGGGPEDLAASLAVSVAKVVAGK